MQATFERLSIYREAHALVLLVYRYTENLPRKEMFGLTSQVRRSAASVAANIAEGCGRGSAKDMINFLAFSRGSAMETIEHLTISRDLGYLNETIIENLIIRYRGLAAGITALIVRKRQSPT